MNEIFMIFLSLSLSGSLVALFYFLLKPFIKNKLSKSWQYYILLVVILRFLIPIGPETSLVGIMLNQTESFDVISSPVFNMLEIDYVPQVSFVEMPTKPENKTNNPQHQENAGKTVMELIWFFWLTPAFLLMLRKIIIYQRSVHSINAGCKIIDNNHVLDIYREVNIEMKIRNSLNIAQNDKIAAPMLVGTIRPNIVLPDISLKDNEMRYVLQHELTHYKRFDVLYKWITQITICLHWFNPLIYWICREINRNCELSCDEAIVMRLCETEKYAYGNMLIEAIKLNKKSSVPVISITLNEDTKLIKERLSAIMKFRKISRTSMAISLALAAIFLCGAIYTGVYAQSKGAVTNQISDSNDYSVRELPDKIEFDGNTNALNISFGEYMLDMNVISSADDKVSDNHQTVVYESVVLNRNEENSNPNAHPYIHDIKTNHTNKKIIGFQRGMLAFDKEGNPLKIHWFSTDSASGNTFYFFYDTGEPDSMAGILPGETYDVIGGWSLNINGNDPVVNEIAYVLYNDKEITFDDGTVWVNADFDNWRNTYEGKKIDVVVLDNYYPYVQRIEF